MITTKQQAIQALRGMPDILPDETPWWSTFETIVRAWAADYGYQRINFPIIEPTALFLRSLGETTDIVEKEMFTFIDALNGKSVTLRPEGTASCLRAVLEHHLLYNNPTQRLWYQGPMFRHERPQKGRYRQFHQVGIEALGMIGPDIDAELILMGKDLWERLGLNEHLQLQINSIGDKNERNTHRQALVDYLEKHASLLDEDSLRRLKINPLRILDSKNPALQEICDQAPRLIDYLGCDSSQHYLKWQNMMQNLGIDFIENTRLVRGLDYYNRSVFEWVAPQFAAQSTVCAGGRYDSLMEELGGKPTPAVGFSIGVERLLLLLKEEGISPQTNDPDIYFIQKSEKAPLRALILSKILRQAGYRVLQHAGEAKFSAQFKQADASHAKLALVLGEEEIASDSVTIKVLRENKPQQIVKQSDMLSVVGSLIHKQEQ